MSDAEAELTRRLQAVPEVSFALLFGSRAMGKPAATPIGTWQYRDAFRTLEERRVLSPDLAKKMEGWAGLRNILVHVYLEVDYATLHDILQNDLDELEAFARAIVLAT